jgi:pimeloyl-ACP methyl ester carboxylesterase
MQVACLMAAAAAPRLELNTVPGGVMKYYVSLPEQWTAGKTWPVVVVIESANKEFEETAGLFVRARGTMPFIIVAPLAVTNGGARSLEAPSYRYSAPDWAAIERAGNCNFDLDGIAAAVADVRKRYGGEERYFLTGWEAGGHTVFALLFRRPEQFLAVAPVSPNYQGRCLEPAQFSAWPGRSSLPVCIFEAGASELSASGHSLYNQARAALKTAVDQGFGRVSIVTVPGEPHSPMPRQVLDYFYSEWKPAQR